MIDGGSRQLLGVGDSAPDFCLPNQFGEPITLSALRGSAVVLVFYPFAFSGTCTSELGQLRDSAGRFAEAGVHLLAISVDTKYSLRAYASAERLDFDLLTDFWPHGAVAKDYGVFDSERGMAGRGTFVLRADGTVADSFTADTGQARQLTRYWQALEAL